MTPGLRIRIPQTGGLSDVEVPFPLSHHPAQNKLRSVRKPLSVSTSCRKKSIAWRNLLRTTRLPQCTTPLPDWLYYAVHGWVPELRIAHGRKGPASAIISKQCTKKASSTLSPKYLLAHKVRVEECKEALIRRPESRRDKSPEEQPGAKIPRRRIYYYFCRYFYG